MRPDVGIVEDVPAVVLGFIGIHDLYIEGPGEVVAVLDCVIHVLDVVIRLLASKLSGIGWVHDDVARVRLEMDLDVFECDILRLAELESVDSVSIHVSQAFGSTSLAEHLHQAVCAFLIVVVEVQAMLELGTCL